eukprot:jgi/Undpi1/10791/HiC_scaffold_29.g13239.m1
MSVASESAFRASASAAISQAPPAISQGPPAQDGAPVVPGEEAEPADPYYWEEGGDPNLDWWGKIRHNLHFGGVKAIAGAESIGEVVANTLGLNDSEFQYVIDALELDEMRREREERDAEDMRQMALQAQAAANKAAQEAGDRDAAQDAGSIELGDARVSLDEGDEAAVSSREASAVDIHPNLGGGSPS